MRHNRWLIPLLDTPGKKRDTFKMPDDKLRKHLNGEMNYETTLRFLIAAMSCGTWYLNIRRWHKQVWELEFSTCLLIMGASNKLLINKRKYVCGLYCFGQIWKMMSQISVANHHYVMTLMTSFVVSSQLTDKTPLCVTRTSLENVEDNITYVAYVIIDWHFP